MPVNEFERRECFILLTFNSRSDSLRLEKTQVIARTEGAQKQLEGVIEKIKGEVLKSDQ